MSSHNNVAFFDIDIYTSSRRKLNILMSSHNNIAFYDIDIYLH